ncbi:NEDD8-activating enzyme E1 regulatory subunit [Erysiphe neolycopersici]|uniref:NEDD8-activating enzyme E1 regulatory subunit n=1 Tax=Erysiphe neolycopersici TaxID=212602 RepID=A0A420HZT7_9PEZI|nr:NEDD8-activating enzyme E1 regulatory subunit [Erysiphe neolycopersici]
MTEDSENKTSLSFQGPSEREKKYDRQLRLWAADGQEALERADVLLINSGSGVVGVEILKNLILPGIGKFTIIDNNKVSETDLGANFFLDEACLGKSRAECCVYFLQELNQDALGEFHSTLDVPYLESLFKKRCFSFILCTLPVQAEILSFIKNHTNNSKIPLILIHSLGFYSYFRSILPVTIPIVNTHPEAQANTDLRLLNPWKELSEFSQGLTKNIDQLNDHQHGHIPYVALLLHFLAEWKKSHGSWPDSYSERMEFRKIVAASARTNTGGREENFDEAVAAVMRNIKIPTLSAAAQEVFEYQPNDKEAKSNFWIIADAVKQFYKKYSLLPLPGSLPDMKAESSVYVQLQNIYKKKARRDIAEIFDIILRHPYGKNVQMIEVESFCKNAAHIKLIHAFNDTMDNLKLVAKTEFENDKISNITSQPLSLLPIYLALRAISHVPTATYSYIITAIKDEIPEAGSNERVQKVSQEVARAKGGELHNISSLTGGMVAQEVIKLITKQYIPMDNTCIFDGITSRVQILRI